MPQISYRQFSDVVLFTNTFLPGGVVFPTPQYFFLETGDEITFTRTQSFASTGHFNIDPAVTVSGSNLQVNGNGALSGTINTMEFSSQNRGVIGTITGLSLSGSEFSDLIFDRIFGIPTVSSEFDAYLGEGIGPLELNSTDDSVTVRGFLEHIEQIDLGGGDDAISVSDSDLSVLRRVDGGEGDDRLNLSSFGPTDVFVVDLAEGRIVYGDSTLEISGFEEVRGNLNVQEYIGSDGNDRIFADFFDDVVSGGEGNDFLSGGNGNDVLNGGVGNDTLDGGDGNDTLNGGLGDDELRGWVGDDTIITGSGADYVLAATGQDVIRVTSSGEFDAGLFAFNVSSDTQVGTQARINLEGTAQLDVVLNGGSDFDRLELSAQNDAFFLHDAFSGFNTSVELSADSTGRDSAARLADIESILGFGGDDLIDLTSPDYSLSGNTITIDGGQGNDVIWGSDADEVILGGSGDDTLFAGIGEDVLSGGSGADVFEFTRTSTQTTVTDFDATQGDVLRFYNAAGAQFDASSLALTATGITISYVDLASASQQTLSIDLAQTPEDFTSTLAEISNALEVI